MEILEFIKKEKELTVVSTLDGKEFMTIDFLDSLIYETCLFQKKTNIQELETLINVDS